MDDDQIHGHIEQLVAEEHKLWNAESSGHATDDDRRRLEAVKVSLDQCWDLLRQRRALRDDGANPDDAQARDESVVERYLQQPHPTATVASYALNERAVAHAEELIRKRQYVLRSEWNQAQPRAEAQNAFLKNHSWEEYAEWHLGLTEGAKDDTKARYAFVYGDLRRLHRMGLIATVYRASEWRHKAIELAAHDLLQLLDSVSG